MLRSDAYFDHTASSNPPTRRGRLCSTEGFDVLPTLHTVLFAAMQHAACNMRQMRRKQDDFEISDSCAEALQCGQQGKGRTRTCGAMRCHGTWRMIRAFVHIFCAFLVWLAKRLVAFSSSLLISARSLARAAGFAIWNFFAAPSSPSPAHQHRHDGYRRYAV